MPKITHKVWTVEETEFLRTETENGLTCEEIARSLNRTTRSVQHKFSELRLKKPIAKVGDIVKGWRIVEVYLERAGSQNVRMAKVESTINDKVGIYRLTELTNKQLGWPDRRRPDLTIKNTTHGDSNSRLYGIWNGMKCRCLNENQLSYMNYGGRGITICKDWLDSYENFKKWSTENGYSEELTLDRVDVNGNYCPENCRWVSQEVQNANKRNSNTTTLKAFGEEKTLIEWSHDKRCVVSLMCLKYRVFAKWEPEKALTTPTERQAASNCLDKWLQDRYPDIYQEFVSGR